MKTILLSLWVYAVFFMACTGFAPSTERHGCAETVSVDQLAAFYQGSELCDTISCVEYEARQRILITAEYVSVCEKANVDAGAE